MNICTVLPWFPSYVSGESTLAVFVHRELKKLVERGHKSVVITIQRPGMPAFEVMDGIQVYRFPSRAIKVIRYDIPSFARLNCLIADVSREHKLDLVQFVNSQFLTSIPAINIKKNIDIPVVVVVNGIPGISWISGSRIIDAIGWVYTNVLGQRIIKAADGVRLLQSPVYDDVTRFGVDGNRISVIHRSVDTGIFHPGYDNLKTRAELGIEEEDFMVLWAGRLAKPVEMKGTWYLIQAIKELLPAHNNLKLVMVGDGNGREKNEEWVKDIKSNVIFTGIRNDVYRYMSAADVFVLPSLCEGCPNVVLESSACGTAVIASRVGAVPDIIENGENGIIVRPKSVIDIKQALTRLIENPDLRLEMGGKARKRMEQEFTGDAISLKLEEFYSATVERFKKEGR